MIVGGAVPVRLRDMKRVRRIVGGARPSNNAPDALHIAQANRDGTPDYHGWPDRYGFLEANQRVYNPVGGPGDDLCVPDPTNPPSMCTPASVAKILAEDVP